MLASLESDLGQPTPRAAGWRLCARGDFAAVARSPTSAAPARLGEAAARAGEPRHVERLYALLEPHARPIRS